MVKTWMLAGAALLAAPGLAACTSGPKLSELASDLQKDSTTFIDSAAYLEGVEGVRPTITDDGSKDVACDDGKVKRVFAGSFPFKPRPDVDANFDFAFNSVLAKLDRERYELTTEPDSDDLSRREFVVTGKDDLKLTLTFTFTGGATPRFAVHSETACLKP